MQSQSFLDALKAAPDSSQAKLNIFLTSFNPTSNKIGIFLEGRDDPSFFRVHVSRAVENFGLIDLEIKSVVLNRKEEVLKAWRYFGERFPEHPKLMFFVDKDHDDFLNIEDGSQTQGNLFVTSCYSVENYLVSVEAIAAILTDIWGLDSSSEAIAVVCSNFRRFQQAYRNAFQVWMAWIIAVRRLGEKPNLRDLNRSLLRLNDNHEPILHWKPDIFSHLERICNIPVSPDNSVINDVKSELDVLPTQSWLRGKQEVWCLVAFLEKVERDISQDENLGNIRIRSRINVDNTVEILAPRLSCPDDLRQYLQDRLEKL